MKGGGVIHQSGSSIFVHGKVLCWKEVIQHFNLVGVIFQLSGYFFKGIPDFEVSSYQHYTLPLSLE